jgi:hypothetical protein
MRADFLKEQKKWEAEKARSAPDYADIIEMEAEEGKDTEDLIFNRQMSIPWHQSQSQTQSYQQDQSQYPLTQTLPYQTFPDFEDEAEAEAMLEQERQEIEAMASMLEDAGMSQWSDNEMAMHYGSDDEDFEELFMELSANQEDSRAHTGQINQSKEPDGMDMS